MIKERDYENKWIWKIRKKVVNRIACDHETKKRLREDILDALYARYDETGETDPVEILGNPADVAIEFKENLGDRLLQNYQEYKSI